jgi:hypothetical protein
MKFICLTVDLAGLDANPIAAAREIDIINNAFKVLRNHDGSAEMEELGDREILSQLSCNIVSFH